MATTGGILIKYNRIVSSSISPYAIDTVSTRSFRDPNTSPGFCRAVKDLIIIDINNVKALIYECTYQLS